MVFFFFLSLMSVSLETSDLKQEPLPVSPGVGMWGETTGDNLLGTGRGGAMEDTTWEMPQDAFVPSGK